MHTQSPLGFKSVAFFLSLKAHSANNCLSYLAIISCREDFKKHICQFSWKNKEEGTIKGKQTKPLSGTIGIHSI